MGTIEDTEILNYVQASGIFAKRASAQLEAGAAAAKRAADATPALLDAMVASGLLKASDKQAAAATMTDHAKTLQVFTRAVKKMAEDRTKAAALQLGSGEGDPSADPLVNDPRIPAGARSTHKRASDLAFERTLRGQV